VVANLAQVLSIAIDWDNFSPLRIAMAGQNSAARKIHQLKNQTYLFFNGAFPCPKPFLQEF
jgi:hypothetical protein